MTTATTTTTTTTADDHHTGHSHSPPTRTKIHQSRRYHNCLKQFLLRPSLWIGLIAIIAYWDEQALHGEFVYDDAGSVKRNVVVTGQVPWMEVLTRDYWGTQMQQAQSHKSYRPITTATFIINWKLAAYLQTLHTPQHTYWFHVVNVILHGIVTMLLVEVTSLFVFPHSIQSSMLVGLWFGLHPVHAEAVSNITSRGELLMSLFFWLAFYSYASATTTTIRDDHHHHHNNNTTTMTSSSSTKWRHYKILCQMYIIPWICTACSLLSKEQGATTLMALVFYDFISKFGSLQGLWIQLLHDSNHKSSKEEVVEEVEETEPSCETKESVESSQQPLLSSSNNMDERDDTKNSTRANQESTGNALTPSHSSTSSKEGLEFVGRTLLLGLQTIVLCYLRYSINGPTRPDFIEDQNPAGFAADAFTRRFSIPLVYCLYLYDILWPTTLCPDWSGRSIRLITNWTDVRIVPVIVLWIWIAMSTYRLIWEGSSTPRYRQRQILIAFWAFVVTPFLLSSNVLVVVGLMKADRVIYLPLAGICMIQAIAIEYVQEQLMQWGATYAAPWPKVSKIVQHLLQAFLLLQLAWYCAKLHERNMAWSRSELLWQEAYRINPISYHTMYNYGYELSLKRKFHLAEQVLRPIADPHVNGPSNTFVYALVLQNLKRCDEANAYMDRALEVAEEFRRDAAAATANNTTKSHHNNIRHSDSSYVRVKSNLLVARSLCSNDVSEAGKLMYEAVQVDPTNEYAVEQAKAMLQHYERIQQQQQLLLTQMGNQEL